MILRNLANLCEFEGDTLSVDVGAVFFIVAVVVVVVETSTFVVVVDDDVFSSQLHFGHWCSKDSVLVLLVVSIVVSKFNDVFLLIITLGCCCV